MVARASTAPLLGLGVDRGSAEPLHRQLYGQIRDAILAGGLAPGTRLPSSRALAGELGLSRNTVATAFDQLLSEGYVEGSVGSGTYVSSVLPDELLAVRARAGEPLAEGEGGGRLSRRGQLLAAHRTRQVAPHPAFAVGLPDFDAFPADVWGRLVARCWRHPSRALMNMRDPGGYPPLRRAIAAYLRAVRAVACDAEQVIVTAGGQHGLDLAFRLLLDPGDAAWIEEPGYVGFRTALAAAGGQAVPVPVDAEGIDVAEGRRRAPAARIAAVSPSHQYPLGVTMSLARRLALLDWAREAGAWVLEDDYNSEYRYRGRPLAALQGLDDSGRVVYVGSFSKVMFPALRLGYLVVPPDLVDPFRRARAALDDHPSIVAQPALAEFIEAGHFAAHVRRTRARYGERQGALVDALRRRLDGMLTVAPDDAGMHLVAGLAFDRPDRDAAAAAARHRVSVTPLADFFLEAPTRAGLLLGYSGVTPEEIDAGAARLAEAIGG